MKTTVPLVVVSTPKESSNFILPSEVQFTFLFSNTVSLNLLKLFDFFQLKVQTKNLESLK